MYLMQRAQQVSLNTAAVQDMRQQLRLAIIERAGQTELGLPFAQPLPEVGEKPLPLLQLPNSASPRPVTRGPWARWMTSVSPATLAFTLAFACAVGAFAPSIAFYLPEELSRADARSLDWDVRHDDLLIVLAAATLGSALGCRLKAARPATATATCFVLLFVSGRALGLSIRCAERRSERAPPAPPPPPLDCISLRGLWPLILCGLVGLAALLQVVGLCVERSWPCAAAGCCCCYWGSDAASHRRPLLILLSEAARRSSYSLGHSYRRSSTSVRVSAADASVVPT